jgi:Ca2+-binding RTX toxin-like protein
MAAVAVSAAPAQAAATGVASVVGAQLTFKAGSGKTNRVWITQAGGKVTVDDRVAVKPGKGCRAVKGDKTKVTCAGAEEVSVSLGSGNDVFVNISGLVAYAYGNSGNDTLNGGTGRDVLRGGSGNDTVNGGAGNDYVYGETGNDKVYGGTGNDRMYGDSGSDQLHGGAGRDLIRDGSGNDRVYGDAGNDVLYDNKGKDRYYGSAGDDVLQAGDGKDADRYSGGAGTDTVDYQHMSEPVTAAGGVTADADGVAGDDGRSGEHDTIATDVENLIGSHGSDRLYGTAGANLLIGGGGNDHLYGGGGNDTLNGDHGKDRLDGGAGNDHLIGGIGVSSEKETLYADVLIGGTGVDLVDYRDNWVPVTVDLDGRSGDDGVKGEGDTVGADVENIIGGYGSNFLTGNAGNNVLTGGEGRDVLRGLGGDDVLLSDTLPGVTSDAVTDSLDGGAHVNGDTCGYDAEDTAVECEIKG